MIQGVATLVKERMQASTSGQGKHLRPMLLFPEVKTNAIKDCMVSSSA